MKKVMIVWPGHAATPGANKSTMRKVQELKQIEAEIRQEHTDHANTKKHRLGKCECYG